MARKGRRAAQESSVTSSLKFYFDHNQFWGTGVNNDG